MQYVSDIRDPGSSYQSQIHPHKPVHHKHQYSSHSSYIVFPPNSLTSSIPNHTKSHKNRHHETSLASAIISPKNLFLLKTSSSLIPIHLTYNTPSSGEATQIKRRHTNQERKVKLNFKHTYTNTNILYHRKSLFPRRETSRRKT